MAERFRGTLYIEECAFYAGKCSSADQVALTARAIREASLDNFAVIDQLVLGKLVPPGSRIVLAGHSRGGFLLLVMAADRPGLVKGVINFAGGWHGVNDRMSAADYEPRIKEQTVRLKDAARKVTVPTIWIYADRDVFYNEPARQEMLRAWRDGGGKAEYIFFAEHQLPNPHAVHSAPALWGKQLDAFLKALDAPDSGKPR
jgi:pimeloyl-ACP methyl ester carboxylesterase